MGVTAVAIRRCWRWPPCRGRASRGIYGAVLRRRTVWSVRSALIKHVLRFFPSVVTGTIITMIGVVLMRVGVAWAGGGAAAADFGAGGLPCGRRAWCLQ